MFPMKCERRDAEAQSSPGEIEELYCILLLSLAPRLCARIRSSWRSLELAGLLLLRAHLRRAFPIVEHEEDGAEDQREADGVVPLQRLAEVQRGEDGEDHERDHFLHHLELRRRK